MCAGGAFSRFLQSVAAKWLDTRIRADSGRDEWPAIRSGSRACGALLENMLAGDRGMRFLSRFVLVT